MEKRRFSRVLFNTSSQFIFEEKVYPLKLINISLKGALLENVESAVFPSGAEGIMEIKLPSSNIKIRQHAELLYVNDNKLGFQFKGSDLDSLTHLRKLLEYNTDSPEKIKEELFFLFDKSGDK
jgi:hypothetical protein